VGIGVVLREGIVWSDDEARTERASESWVGRDCLFFFGANVCCTAVLSRLHVLVFTHVFDFFLQLRPFGLGTRASFSLIVSALFAFIMIGCQSLDSRLVEANPFCAVIAIAFVS